MVFGYAVRVPVVGWLTMIPATRLHSPAFATLLWDHQTQVRHSLGESFTLLSPSF
jgi:hypothetical protein